MDRSRWSWAPGLRARTAITMVAAVAVACAALTITTTSWAAAQHRQTLERQLTDSVSRDIAQLYVALKEDPAARTLKELGETGWHDDDGWDDSASIGEAILIPLDGRAKKVDPDRSFQWGFVNFTEPLKERFPECLHPKDWPPGPLLSGGSSMTWNESCGPYLLAYGEAQPGTDTHLEDRWLVIRALYLPDQEDENPVPALRNTLLSWSAGIVAATALLALTVASSVVRPATRAGTMADAVAAGDLSTRIPVHGRDEVARMSQAINTMADRLTGQIAELERANESQRRFVSDVAHELRTPTTALLASAEALRDPETRDEAAELVAPQLGRLAALTEDLLEISRMDAGHATLITNRIDAVDLITEILTDTPAGITYTGPSELWLTTDPVRLQAILRNLVTNAIQHGEPPVTITLTHREYAVSIDIHDEGTGVPDDLRDRIFDRFVRGDQSRHGTSSGLGLAIARENAHLLGGTLTLQPDGSTFRLTIPIQG